MKLSGTKRDSNPAARRTFAGRISAILNRVVGGMRYGAHITAANRWRDNYNPLRGLTIARAVSMLEDGERGAYADVQWTYRFIEMQDATLGALIERRTSAIQQMDWDIKVRDDLPAAAKAIAQRQQDILRAAYEAIENYSEAVEFLEMAAFRGYAHLEKILGPDGRIIRLAPIEQWFWVRDGIRGEWQYNPLSALGATRGEPVDASRLVIREVARPINRVALIAFVRKGLSQKDWDGFIESYGIPPIFPIMPPDVPPDKEAEYLAMAEAIASDARGTLPHGSDIKTVEIRDRGGDVFKIHLDYQDAQVVLRGTGGKLTMLNDPTGLGSGQSESHENTFEEIAAAEAAEISEVLRRAIDQPLLDRAFPGQPRWAYFEIASEEETNVTAIVADVVALSNAGFKVRPEWIAEKTGYEFAEILPASDPAQAEPQPSASIENRYNPMQRRHEQGVKEGGRWAAEGFASKGARAKRGKMREATADERKKLGIPPAYTDAMICDDPASDVLATARTAAGKPWVRYSEAYNASQAAAKFARIAALNDAMPGIQQQIDADIAAGGEDAAPALALRMITLTGMRNGGDEQAGKVKSFGASNILTEACRVDGDKVHLDFVGKKGVRQRHSFEDATLARHIEKRIADGTKTVFDTDADRTLDYLSEISGAKFKVHDFRTWYGTSLADAACRKLIERGEIPATPRDFKRAQVRVSRVVSRALGNTPTVCRKSYIHPLVWDQLEPFAPAATPLAPSRKKAA